MVSYITHNAVQLPNVLLLHITQLRMRFYPVSSWNIIVMFYSMQHVTYCTPYPITFHIIHISFYFSLFLFVPCLTQFLYLVYYMHKGGEGQIIISLKVVYSM